MTLAAQHKALKARHKELLYKLSEDFANLFLGCKLPLEIYESQTGTLLVPMNRKITKGYLRVMAEHWNFLEIDPSPIRNRVLQMVAKYDEELAAVEKELSEVLLKRESARQ